MYRAVNIEQLDDEKSPLRMAIKHRVLEPKGRPNMVKLEYLKLFCLLYCASKSGMRDRIVFRDALGIKDLEADDIEPSPEKLPISN